MTRLIQAAILRPLAVLTLALFLTGCATQAQINQLVHVVDAQWSKDYRQLMDKFGYREYRVPIFDAIASMQDALENIGMVVDGTDLSAGVVRASSVTPSPLTRAEWEEMAAETEMQVREIISKQKVIGVWFWMDTGYEKLVLAASFATVQGAVGVTFNSKLIELPRGEFSEVAGHIETLPPIFARLLLVKLWKAFDQELVSRGHALDRIRNGAPREKENGV